MRNINASNLFHSKQLLTALSLIILLIALPLIIIFSRNIQETHQRAAGSQADITVDFGNRQNQTHPIMTHFGLSGVGMNGVISSVHDSLNPANLVIKSYTAQIEEIFKKADSTNFTDPAHQDWTQFDADWSPANQYMGYAHIILQGSPTWLQPQTFGQTNWCMKGMPYANPQYPYHAFPTHINQNGIDDGLALYAQLSAIVLDHVAKTFPNLKASYEIWNEPDSFNAWCIDNTQQNIDTTRQGLYKQMFIASAAQLKTQAVKDGVSLNIGGPSVTNLRVDTWIPWILADSQMSSYLSYIVYHKYTDAGTYDRLNGHPNPNPTWQDVVNATQDTTTNNQGTIGFGFASFYERVSQYLRQARQKNPNLPMLPIYHGEYNCDTICRQDGTYAPLWNALLITDYLNSVNDINSQYGPADNVPGGLTYWAWDNRVPASMCMFANLDTSLDCSPNTPIQPYPQYYSYLLFGSTNYLNIRDNSFVANSATSNDSGVYATGFYTNSLDNIVVVNTSSTPYPAMNIVIQNPGTLPNLNATFYKLTFNKNQPSSSIQSQPITMQQIDANTIQAIVNVPATTTIAISFNASINGSPPPTQSPTPKVTHTPTPTIKNTPTATPSLTPTSSLTPTPTGRSTPTATPSLTPTISITVTPTPTSLLTPTPTPTPNPNASSLSFTIGLHGLGTAGDNVNPTGGNTNPLHPTRSLSVSLFDTSNSLVAQQTSPLVFHPSPQNPSFGLFTSSLSFSSLPPGDYQLLLSSDGFLPSRLPGNFHILPSHTTIIPPLSLVNGNVNNDNQLDILDYNIIISCIGFGTMQPPANCPSQYAPSSSSQGADITDDGVVDGFDYNLFVRELSVQKGG